MWPSLGHDMEHSRDRLRGISPYCIGPVHRVRLLYCNISVLKFMSACLGGIGKMMYSNMHTDTHTHTHTYVCMNADE